MINFTENELKVIFHALIDSRSKIQNSTLLVDSEIGQKGETAISAILAKICRSGEVLDIYWRMDYDSVCREVDDWFQKKANFKN